MRCAHLSDTHLLPREPAPGTVVFPRPCHPGGQMTAGLLEKVSAEGALQGELQWGSDALIPFQILAKGQTQGAAAGSSWVNWQIARWGADCHL